MLLALIYKFPTVYSQTRGLYISSPAPSQSHSLFVVFLQVPDVRRRFVPTGLTLSDCLIPHLFVVCCVALSLLSVDPVTGRSNVDPAIEQSWIVSFFFFTPYIPWVTQYPRCIPTVYPHGIYTVPKDYTHGIYIVPKDYTHGIYTVPTVYMFSTVYT